MKLFPAAVVQLGFSPGDIRRLAGYLGLIRQEIKMSEPLLASGAISKVELLRLRRTEVETAGQLNSI
ncbi:hypothetical protein, partial [Citrobacter portucalensis]|uniref:hypothetical protein n=1 Tax=Citrobacter portucalensis TaxID=1639133 RepID=UPI00397E4B54